MNDIITAEFLQKFKPIYFRTIQKTGNDILNWLQSKHFHREEDYTTPHRETLYQHLVDCGSICNEYMVSVKKKPFSWKYYLAGFLHDIGKPGTTKRWRNRKLLTMKGHAIVGAAILDSWMFCENEFRETFNLTKSDLECIAAVTNYHMCGYFPNQTDEFRIDCFKACMNEEARELLCGLRVGDCNGREPKCVANDADFWDTQDEFEKLIRGKFEYEKFSKNFEDGNGVLISVQGYSGNGKTSISKYIEKYLDYENIVVVNRDAIMYEMMVQEMNQGKKEDGKEIPYGEVYNYYKNHENKREISKSLNDIMREKIQSVLSANRICIVDTMATLSPRIRTEMFPPIVKKSLRIFVWVHRAEYMGREDNNNNNDYQDYKNPIGYSIAWDKMISVTEERRRKNTTSLLGEEENKQLLHQRLGENERLLHQRRKENEGGRIVVDDNNFRPHFSLPISFDNTTIMYGSLGELLLNVVAPKQQQQQQLLGETPSSRIIEETLNLSLKELLEGLLLGGGGDDIVGTITNFFKTHRYIVKMKYYPDVDTYTVIIRYIDGLNTLWQPRWAREARGRAYAIVKTKKKKKNIVVVEVKKSLERGVELLTREHLKRNISETQDLSIHNAAKLDYLDERQRELAVKFAKNDNVRLVDCYVSQKVDGSLLVVSVYPKGSLEYTIMSNVVARNEAMWHVFTEKSLIVPATSGNIKIGEDMKDYALTCFLAALRIRNNNNKEDIVDVESIWHHRVKNEFAQLIDSIVDGECRRDDDNNDGLMALERERTRTRTRARSFSNQQSFETLQNSSANITTASEMVSLIFEMVCANRNTIKNNLHTELTISYDESDLYLLGMCRGDEYIPHYLFRNQRHDYVKFPLYRRVYNTLEVIDMLKDFDNVLLEDMTAKQYHEKWFEKNYFDYPKYDMHLEGFTFLQHNNADNTVTYSKIKHPLYYTAHKLLSSSSSSNFDRAAAKVLDKYANSSTVLQNFPAIGKYNFLQRDFSSQLYEFARVVLRQVFIEKIIHDPAPFQCSYSLTAARERFMNDTNVNLKNYHSLFNFVLATGIVKSEIIKYARKFFAGYLNSDAFANDDEFYRRLHRVLATWKPWLINLEDDESAIDISVTHFRQFIDYFK